MSLEEFARAMYTIATAHKGSVTSWGRTDTRSRFVGGFAYDPHTWWLGCDLIYDDEPPPLEPLKATAASLGLKVIRETSKPHDHFQPLNFPAGPVTIYEGQTRSVA